MNKKKCWERKFPENKKILAKLLQGDPVKIAKYAGLSPTTVRAMLNGYRRITDKAASAIIRLMNERRELTKSLEEITKHE